MANKVREKASFIIDQGTYYYNVIPFKLENTRETFQRLVSKVFVNQIGYNMDLYVKDISQKDWAKNLKFEFKK